MTQEAVIAAVTALDGRVARIEATQAVQTEQIADIKAILGRLEPLLIKVLEAQAEMRGEMRGQLDQMGHRISDINARLPVPIGYTPPEKRSA